jgi:hypothetical protein
MPFILGVLIAIGLSATLVSVIERLNKSTEIAKNLADDERPERNSRVVENPAFSTGASRKSPKIAKNIEPRPITDIKPDQKLSFNAPTIADPARDRKLSRDVNNGTARLAEAVPNLDGRSHLAPIPRSRGLGLFMFAPPGF